MPGISQPNEIEHSVAGSEQSFSTMQQESVMQTGRQRLEAAKQCKNFVLTPLRTVGIFRSFSRFRVLRLGFATAAVLLGNTPVRRL